MKWVIFGKNWTKDRGEGVSGSIFSLLKIANLPELLMSLFSLIESQIFSACIPRVIYMTLERPYGVASNDIQP